MYVVERWLARLSRSRYAADFILKGGMLLATFDARRPTADADTLARNLPSDQQSVVATVSEIAGIADPDDGVLFHPDTVAARTIRDAGMYEGTRVTMQTTLASAKVKLSLDVNFGDPVVPAPRLVRLPALREGMADVQVLGYPIETVIAEKLCTAVQLGELNTRVRDYADIYSLIGTHGIDGDVVRAAVSATATFRGTTLERLSVAAGGLAELRQNDWAAYRRQLGPDADRLPSVFADVVASVSAFADPILTGAAAGRAWSSATKAWVNPSRGRSSGSTR